MPFTPHVADVTAIDWPKLRAMHMKGMSLKQISASEHVDYARLRQRAARQRWSHHVAMVETSMSRAVTNDVHTQAKIWISQVTDVCNQHLQHVLRHSKGKPPLRVLKQLAEVLEITDRTARRNYGLDQSSTLNVLVMSPGKASAGPDHVLEPDHIDVSSEPVQDSTVPETPTMNVGD